MNDDGAPTVSDAPSAVRSPRGGATATLVEPAGAERPVEPPAVGTASTAHVARSRRPWFVGRLLLLLAVAAVLLLAALWPRAPFALDVGAPGDRLFLDNAHGDERVAEYSYRWTGKRSGDTTLTVPGWGAVSRARLTLRLQALPDKAPLDLQILSRGRVVVGTVSAGSTMAEEAVDLALPGGSSGADLILALRSPASSVPGDPRQLGVKLDAARLEPLERDAAAYWRTVWPSWFAALVLVVALLLLIGPGSGRAAWGLRGAVVLGLPLATALALPWTLALLPWAIAGTGGGLALRYARWWPERLAALWAALDRPRLAARTAAAGVLLYAVLLTAQVLRVPWIGHADYADNAVVARNLVRGHGFSVDYVAQFYRQWGDLRHPADTWPPLQPLLIAPFFALFGPETAAAKLPNVLVMAGLLWLAYRVGAALWSPRVGLLAGLLLAVQLDLFLGVVYPLNDLAFTLLAFACVVLLWDLANAERGTRNAEQVEASTEAARNAPTFLQFRSYSAFRVPRSALLLGVLGGLLVLGKPSGAVLLAGGALWVLWSARRRGTLRPVLRAGLLAAVIAALVWLPWGARNLVTFGAPFYSTESKDAWVIEYRPWENIYRAYAWGVADLPHPRLLVGYGFDAVTAKVTRQFRLAWQGAAGGQILPLSAVLLAAVGGCATLVGRRRALLAVLAAAATAYALFVLLYWHYEDRYAFFLLPWGALLAAAGLWWLHDRLAEVRHRALAAVVTAVAIAALVVPQARVLWDTAAVARRVPSSVAVAEWLRDNTPPDTVIMTRDPWELSWHSERRSVMIPFDDLATIRTVAAHYGAGYLQLDNLDRVERPALAPLYKGREEFGFRKVYEVRGGDGRVIGIVYRFPDGGR